MLIRRQGKAFVGFLLGISFFAVLALIFAPVFDGTNDLEFSDRLFNRLAKGSSNFLPALSSQVAKLENQELAVSLEMDSPGQAALATKVLSESAPATTAQGPVLNVKGNLTEVLGAAISDCQAMYSNHGEVLRQEYGMDPKEAMLIWHTALNGTAQALERGNNKNIAHAKMIQAVVTDGVEPAYNFYGIEAESVSRRAGITTFLLIFYLVYTLWWGFAIYFLFGGLGFSMTKARVKREI